MNTKFDYSTNDDIVINQITETDEDDFQHELSDKLKSLNYNIFNQRAINVSNTNRKPSSHNQANQVALNKRRKSVELIRKL